MMAHKLKNEIAVLSGFVNQISQSSLVTNATTQDGAQVKKLLHSVVEQISILNEEVEDIQLALEVRDLNIRSLGEKLADLHEASPDNVPFVVKGRKRKPEPEVFKLERVSEWDAQRQQALQDEYFTEMARLSLAPMGLESSQLKEQIRSLAAQLKESHFKLNQADSLQERCALGVIRTAKNEGIDEETTRKFLLKKDVPCGLIEQCFSQVNLDNSHSLYTPLSPSDSWYPRALSISEEPALSISRESSYNAA